MFIATLTGFLLMTLLCASVVATSTILIIVYSTNITTLEAKIDQALAAVGASSTIYLMLAYILVRDEPTTPQVAEFCITSQRLATL